MKINEIKDLLQADSIDPAILAELAKDDRKGVQKLLVSYQRRQEKLAKQKEEFLGRFSYEKDFWAKGQLVGGVDEVGRGPLAGPVVAAAVVFPRGVPWPGVYDSKQLKAADRERLDREIRSVPGVRIGIGEVPVEEIDRINILNATHRAMREAVLAAGEVDFILVDGRPVKNLPCPSRALVKGDSRSASIAAASIVAKVYRDRLMDELDLRWPGYGFKEHKGYGTAAHLESLRRLGPCPAHRKSFRPVREIIDPPPEQPELFA